MSLKRAGRPTTNPVHGYFNYDVEENWSICKIGECTAKITVGLKLSEF